MSRVRPASSYVHVQDAYAAIDCRHDIYVVMTRDPISRTVSSFNYRHPIGGSDEVVIPPNGTEVEMYDCFPEMPGGVSRFAEALSEPSRCGFLARMSLHQPSVSASAHLAKGHYHYVIASGLIDVLHGNSSKQVVLVRNEHLDDDLAAVREWLCLPPKNATADPNAEIRSEYLRSNDTALSDKARENLERELGFERFAVESIEMFAAQARQEPAPFLFDPEYSVALDVPECATQCAPP